MDLPIHLHWKRIVLRSHAGFWSESVPKSMLNSKGIFLRFTAWHTDDESIPSVRVRSKKGESTEEFPQKICFKSAGNVYLQILANFWCGIYRKNFADFIYLWKSAADPPCVNILKKSYNEYQGSWGFIHTVWLWLYVVATLWYLAAQFLQVKHVE